MDIVGIPSYKTWGDRYKETLLEFWAGICSPILAAIVTLLLLGAGLLVGVAYIIAKVIPK